MAWIHNAESNGEAGEKIKKEYTLHSLSDINLLKSYNLELTDKYSVNGLHS